MQLSVTFNRDGKKNRRKDIFFVIQLFLVIYVRMPLLLFNIIKAEHLN